MFPHDWIGLCFRLMSLSRWALKTFSTLFAIIKYSKPSFLNNMQGHWSHLDLTWMPAYPHKYSYKTHMLVSPQPHPPPLALVARITKAALAKPRGRLLISAIAKKQILDGFPILIRVSRLGTHANPSKERIIQKFQLQPVLRVLLCQRSWRGGGRPSCWAWRLCLSLNYFQILFLRGLAGLQAKIESLIQNCTIFALECSVLA